MACSMVEPRLAGESATRNPADFSASILSPAPPLPPAMIAPAWPMRRPGGAVTPAMKPQMGFLIRSEEHTSELQSLMRISYAVFCLKKKKNTRNTNNKNIQTYTTPPDNTVYTTILQTNE